MRSTGDSREVAGLFEEWRPDLILLDLHMPYLSGFDVLEQLGRLIPETDYLPILVLTADITAGTKQLALSAGAKDFLTKPFDSTEVVLRIRNLLETRSLHVALRAYNEELEERVRERTRELEEAQIEILERLALAAEYRDAGTAEHTRRVADTAASLAEALGQSAEEIELIRRAAMLHDVG